MKRPFGWPHLWQELLHRHEAGELPATIACVISNRERARDSTSMRHLARLGVPYYFIPNCGPAAPMRPGSGAPTAVKALRHALRLVL